jgi:hypothetical protein
MMMMATTGMHVPFYICIYFTTISAVQAIQRLTVTQLINNKLARIWKEAAVNSFVALSWDV